MATKASLKDSSVNGSKPHPINFAGAAGKLEAESFYKSSYYPDSFQFPYNPDPLVRGNNYTTYDEMRDDDQIKVALGLKKDMVLNSGWAIKCENKEVREFVESNLKSLGEDHAIKPGLDESLRDMISAYDYGHSLSEIIHRSPNDSASGKWELRELRVRPPHSFLYHIDDYGDVKEIEQYAAHGSQKFNPDIFLHFAYQADFGNPYGKSDLRAAHPAWKAKKFVFRMMLRYAERFAGATVVGRYPSGMSPNDITRFNTVVETIQNHTSLTIPEDTKLEFVQVARDSSDAYNKLLHMLNTWISRSLLIPDLLGVSGEQTSGGSLALGKEHFKVFLATIANDKLNLARRITAKAIRPLVQVNFGDVQCEFQFKPMDAGEEADYLRLWVDAVNGKLWKPSEDEVNHLRRKTGFPEGPVTQAELEPQPPAGKSPGKEDGNAKAGEEREAPEDRVEASLAFRKATTYEAKVDFARIKQTLDRSDMSIGREVERLLKRMASDLVDQARARNILARFKPESLESLKLRYVKDLNQALSGHFVTLFREGVSNAKREILPKGINFVADDILPGEFEMIVKTESFKMAGDLSNEVRKKAGNRLYQALKNGTSISDVAKEVALEIGDYTAGQVMTILRTKTTEVFNAARKTFFETDETAQGIIEGYQWSAVMDENTTPICRNLDGRMWDKEDMPSWLMAPAHWNCRSMLVPITKFEPREFENVPSLQRVNRLGGNLFPKPEEK